MAPTIPKKRTSMRAKSTKPKPISGAGFSTRPSTSFSSSNISNNPSPFGRDSDASPFLSSKRDKRTIKHSTFVSRIAKSSSSSKILKRRRPSKKLVTTLESLAGALPDLAALGGAGGMLEGAPENGKIRQKTIRTRPGAGKRKERMERLERERFGRNMAQLSAVTTPPESGDVHTMAGEIIEPASTNTSSRWAALRGFIEQTMEQKEEFKNK